MRIPVFAEPLFGKFRTDRGGEVKPLAAQAGAAPERIHHNVPFRHQRHVNECSDKCAEMLIAYYNRPSDFAAQGKRRPMLDGMSHAALHTALAQAGLEIRNPWPKSRDGKWNTSELAKVLQEGPVMCSIKFGFGYAHSVVLTGIDKDGVLMHDPWKGANVKMSLEKFNQILLPGADSFKLVVPAESNAAPRRTASLAEHRIRHGLSSGSQPSHSTALPSPQPYTLDQAMEFFGGDLTPELHAFLLNRRPGTNPAPATRAAPAESQISVSPQPAQPTQATQTTQTTRATQTTHEAQPPQAPTASGQTPVQRQDDLEDVLAFAGAGMKPELRDFLTRRNRQP